MAASPPLASMPPADHRTPDTIDVPGHAYVVSAAHREHHTIQAPGYLGHGVCTQLMRKYHSAGMAERLLSASYVL